MDTLRANGDEEWASAVGMSFYPLAVDKATPEFTASIRQTALTRGVRVAEVVADANELHRTTKLVRQSPSDDILLLIQLRGTSFVHQQGRYVELSGGQATLCDPIVEYEVGNRADAHQLVLTMPRHVVHNLSAPVAETRARVLTPKIASLRALTALVEETLSEENSLDVHESDALAGVVIDLTRAMFARVTGSSTTSGTRESMIVAAKHYIVENASDPRLTAEQVAASLGLSVRQLTGLLRPEGTPSNLIRQERLRASRQRLTDSRYENLTIAQIASLSGFTDQTTFTRAFKREFSDLPSELRRPFF